MMYMYVGTVAVVRFIEMTIPMESPITFGNVIAVKFVRR